MPRLPLTQTGLAPKHRSFIHHLMKGETINRAGKLAGFGQKTGYDLMRNPAIRSELVKRMNDVGITDNLLARKLKQGLNAKTVPHRDGGVRYDDQFVRKQWADIIFKLRGDYAPEKIESEHKSIQIIIDGNMLKALQDSRAITPAELQALDSEPILEGEIVNDADEIICIAGGDGSIEEKEVGDSLGEGEPTIEEKPCEAREEPNMDTASG